jgi:hypothetical protein
MQCGLNSLVNTGGQTSRTSSDTAAGNLTITVPLEMLAANDLVSQDTVTS